MSTAYIPTSSTRRGAGLALTLLVHALLFIAWRHAHQVDTEESSGPRKEIQWVNILPLKPPMPPKTVPDAPPPRPIETPRAPDPAPGATARPAHVATAPSAQSAPAPPVEQAAAMPAPPAPPTAAPSAPATISAYEMLQQAKRGVGKIDQELRKAYPGQPITAPVANGATRLAQGLQDAADAAPNRWYQAPKVTEILDPGPYGRRRYRVVYPHVTYCITVESNHAPDGIDQMQKGIQQKTTTCDDDEQKPTVQKYK